MKPIVTICVPNNGKQFEDEVEYLIQMGYLIASVSCASHNYESAIDEMWMAILVRPEAMLPIGE